MPTPTIAVKESLDDLKGIGPSTGISGFKLVYVIGKGLYQYKTGDQSSNVPSGNDADNWVAPSEDTSGKSGAWKKLLQELPRSITDLSTLLETTPVDLGDIEPNPPFSNEIIGVTVDMAKGTNTVDLGAV